MTEHLDLFWQEYQDIIHSQVLHPSPRPNKEHWHHILLACILKFAQACQNAHNAEVHPKDGLYSITHTELLHQIKALYSMRDKLEVSDQYIFDKNLQVWDCQSTMAMTY
eukprot:5450045-Ditylum_brightwellii.AAC.1